MSTLVDKGGGEVPDRENTISTHVLCPEQQIACFPLYELGNSSARTDTTRRALSFDWEPSPHLSTWVDVGIIHVGHRPSLSTVK